MRVPDEELFDVAMREYQLLEHLPDHPNIMKVYDIYYNKSQ